LILGLVITYFEGKRLLRAPETALDLGLWTIIGGIIGGRIGFVIANAGAFGEDWLRAFRIWEGGLSFHGAFLGGLLVIAILALFQRRREDPASFWELTDAITPGLALGLVFGWTACLLGGCAYGILGEGVGYLILPDAYGLEGLRFATQIAGLIQSAILFIAFWLLRERWPFAGASFLMFCLIYFTGQFFLEGYRGDEAIYFGPWRLTQAIDLAIVLLAAVGLLILWWQNRSVVQVLEAPDEEPALEEIGTGPGIESADEVPEQEELQV